MREGGRVDGSTPMMSGFLSVCYPSLLVRYSTGVEGERGMLGGRLEPMM